MKLQIILLTLAFAIGTLTISAQDKFFSSGGNVTTENITKGKSLNYNDSKVSIADTEYETSAIYSIMLNVPATMKFCGGDVSLLTRYEENGANYMDVNGTKITNMLAFLKQQGWNALRVRLFVDPSQASAADKGQGVCQSLDYVLALGKRIKQAGFQFLLDFHYSDSWADPAKQFTPAAWSNLSANELYTKIYDYTKDVLQQLVAADATPDFIQTGNEISYGMLWGTSTAAASSLKRCYTSSSDNWDYFTTLLKQAGRACREVCPKAKIVIHTERAGQMNVLNEFYERMKNYGVDYDIIGLSYYPYYHGTLSTLKSSLETLASKFIDKKIMIVETGYYHDWQPSDVKFDLSQTYPITAQGQKQFTDALIETLNGVSNVNGLFWWWPEANEYGLNWSTKRVTDNWYNAGLWDNQTGKALPALYELKNFNNIEDDISEFEDYSFLLSCNSKGNIKINGNIEFTNKIGTIELLENSENTFVFTPKENCKLEQVCLNGFDITLSVENNTLKAVIPANSQMVVTFANESGDMNNDGIINISDVVVLVNMILGQ